MTSWHGNAFRVTDPLWGESTGEWCGSFMFCLSSNSTNCWAISRFAGGLNAMGLRWRHYNGNVTLLATPATPAYPTPVHPCDAHVSAKLVGMFKLCIVLLLYIVRSRNYAVNVFNTITIDTPKLEIHEFGSLVISKSDLGFQISCSAWSWYIGLCYNGTRFYNQVSSLLGWIWFE